VNAFAELVQAQVRADLRALPAAARRRMTVEGRLAGLHSIDQLRTRARAAVPRTVLDGIDGGANDERALRRNRADLAELALHARVLIDVSGVDTRTTVLGTEVAMPILGAPTGLAGLVHPNGEVALARAYTAAGSVYTTATSSSYTIEEIAAVADAGWFQLYVWKDRGLVREVVGRALAAGCTALVVTVDGPRTGSRERDLRNRFSKPPRVTLAALAGGVRRPRWSASFLRRQRFLPAHFSLPGGVQSHAAAFGAQFDPGLTWSDLEWVRSLWNGPLVVKGLMRADDAVTAVGCGADAVVVSNHGGRQLDEAPSTISVLPSVLAAIGGSAEVYIDGGFRRGGDVLKALALGARACLVGRPGLYGLAVAGEAGVRHALRLLTDELELAMALCGCASVSDIESASLLAPAGGGPDARR
jgi:L-lactate dehydrogenase (cytochrome)